VAPATSGLTVGDGVPMPTLPFVSMNKGLISSLQSRPLPASSAASEIETISVLENLRRIAGWVALLQAAC